MDQKSDWYTNKYRNMYIGISNLPLKHQIFVFWKFWIQKFILFGWRILFSRVTSRSIKEMSMLNSEVLSSFYEKIPVSGFFNQLHLNFLIFQFSIFNSQNIHGNCVLVIWLLNSLEIFLEQQFRFSGFCCSTVPYPNKSQNVSSRFRLP